MPSHVFISHSSADADTARRMVAVLEARGIPCWIADRDIQPGSEYAASIIDAIETSRAMLFVVSEHSNASHHVTREAERAVNRGIPLVPVRLEPITLNKSLEYFLSSAHWFNAFPPPVDDHLERLAGSLAHLFSSLNEDQAASALGVKKSAAQVQTPAARRVSSRWPIFAGAVALILIAIGIFMFQQRGRQTAVSGKEMFASPVVSASAPALAAVPSVAPASPGPNPSSAPNSPRRGENLVAQSVGMPMTWVPPLEGWVGTHEVTQEEFAKAGEFVTSRYPGTKRPADSVSWNDAMKFCEALNRMEGAAGRLPEGYTYTLPTDEQWKTYVGDSGIANAVFGRTEYDGTAEVESKPPNVFGLSCCRTHVTPARQPTVTISTVFALC